MQYNPFNPQQPARPDFFVGREPEIKEFERFLMQTIHSSSMNMSITGNRGIGKTSMLVKFESIAQGRNCLVLRLSNFEEYIENIIEFSDYVCSNIKREIISRKPVEKLKNWVATLKPQISWNDVSLSVEQKQIVGESFRSRLTTLWKEAKEQYSAIVILIDEAESLEKIPGILSFLREVFQRTSEESKYMLVLAGKLNFPERMSESFSPLNRFFPVQRLKVLSREEVKDYLEKKLFNVKITINNEALNYVFSKSEGHPYVVVAIAFTIFDSLNENEKVININIIKRAEEKIIAQLEKDFFLPMFHPLSKNAKNILVSLCTNAKTDTFSFNEAVKWSKQKGNEVAPYIKELVRKGILNKPERATYKFFHNLFIDFVKKSNSI